MRAVLCLMAMLALLSLGPMVSAQDQDLEERVDLCIITYRFSADFGTVIVDADQVVTEENMSVLLDDIDTDDDRNITTAEVDAYSDASVRTVREHDALEKLKLVMDSRGSSTATFRTNLTNFEGPIDEDKPRLVTEHRVYEFPTRDAASHILEGGLYARADPEPRDNFVIEFVVIEAPAGWLVHDVNNVTYNEPRVELESFATDRYFKVRFVPEEEGGSKVIPGPHALVVALIGFGCIAMICKDRRRP